MTKPRVSMLLVLTAVVALATIPLRASDMVGVYCLIEKVVLEPNETEPQSAQIWGACALAAGLRGDNYAPAQYGYLYYSCHKNRDATCHSEWADLKSVAGKDQVVGFGARFSPSGRLRKATEKPADADVYPMQFGVQRLGWYPATNTPAFVQQLKEALRKR